MTGRHARPMSIGEQNLESIRYEAGIIDPLSRLRRTRNMLPTQPGAVIEIGPLWFVRLRPYIKLLPSAWFLLPLPASERLDVPDAVTSCVYSDEWVLEKACEAGGYSVVSTVDSGVRQRVFVDESDNVRLPNTEDHWSRQARLMHGLLKKHL